MYTLALAGLIACGFALLLAFIFYIRAQWAFWFYYGEELYWAIGFAMVVLFGIAYLYLVLPPDGTNIFSASLIFLFLSAAQLMCGAERFDDMSRMPSWRWERYARKFLLLFVVAVIAVRFAFVGCFEYRENYRWNHAEPVQENSEIRVFNGKQITRPVSKIRQGYEEITSAIIKEKHRIEKQKKLKQRMLNKRRY